jgi:hypothetical protein
MGGAQGGTDSGAGGSGGGQTGGSGGQAGGSGGATDAGAGGSDAQPMDAPSDSPSTAKCSESTAWGTPVLLAGVNGTGDNDGEGRLSLDELTIYFFSDRAGNNNIFTASRASLSATFGTPQALTAVNTTASEGWPSVTADGLSLYLESNVNGAFQVFVSHRTTVVAQFPAPILVANVNSGSVTGQSFVLPDESALYFVTNATGSIGNYSIFRAVRGSNGQFGTPAIVPTINTPSGEYGPAVAPDELTIYFGSQRTDSPAKGGFDIWKATRASTAASFDPPVNVQELNTTSTEWPDWLSPDHCRIYFTRNGTTGYKIFVATRSM